MKSCFCGCEEMLDKLLEVHASIGKFALYQLYRSKDTQRWAPNSERTGTFRSARGLGDVMIFCGLHPSKSDCQIMLSNNYYLPLYTCHSGTVNTMNQLLLEQLSPHFSMYNICET